MLLDQLLETPVGSQMMTVKSFGRIIHSWLGVQLELLEAL